MWAIVKILGLGFILFLISSVPHFRIYQEPNQGRERGVTGLFFKVYRTILRNFLE